MVVDRIRRRRNSVAAMRGGFKGCTIITGLVWFLRVFECWDMEGFGSLGVGFIWCGFWEKRGRKKKKW